MCSLLRLNLFLFSLEMLTSTAELQYLPAFIERDYNYIDSYKYLGTLFDSQLNFKENTELIVKRGQQRIHLMRKLSSFNVCDTILCNLYHSFIESLLTFSFICWFSGLSVKEKNSLNTTVKVCSKIIGIQQRNLGRIWEKQAAEKAKRIISQPDHIMSTEFLLLPSGRRYKVPRSKSNRFAKSFIPSAI